MMMTDPCTTILDIEDFVFAYPDGEWTGKPYGCDPYMTPFTLDLADECDCLD